MNKRKPYLSVFDTHDEHQFFTSVAPEWLSDCKPALEEACISKYNIDWDYGRIVISDPTDVETLTKMPFIFVHNQPHKIQYVPKERTFTYLSYEIKKAYRQFDTQIWCWNQVGADGVFYLMGHVFMQPYKGETWNFKQVAKEAIEKYSDQGVTVSCVDPTAIYLQIAGH